MTLKPFGSGSRTSSKSPQESSLKAFGSTSNRGKNASSRSITKKPKLAGKPWNERLSYLVQRGFVILFDGDCWVIADRFSNVQDDQPTFKTDDSWAAQKHADALNQELFDLRLKELTARD